MDGDIPKDSGNKPQQGVPYTGSHDKNSPGMNFTTFRGNHNRIQPNTEKKRLHYIQVNPTPGTPSWLPVNRPRNYNRQGYRIEPELAVQVQLADKMESLNTTEEDAPGTQYDTPFDSTHLDGSSLQDADALSEPSPDPGAKTRVTSFPNPYCPTSPDAWDVSSFEARLLSLDASALALKASALALDARKLSLEMVGPSLVASTLSCELAGPSLDASTQPLNVDRQSLNTSAQTLEASALSRDKAGPSLDMAVPSLNMSAFSLDMAGLSLDASTQPIDMAGPSLDGSALPLNRARQSLDAQPIDMARPSLNTSAVALDASALFLDKAGPSLDMAVPSLNMSAFSLDMAGQFLDASIQPIDLAAPSLDSSTQSIGMARPSLNTSELSPDSSATFSPMFEKVRSKLQTALHTLQTDSMSLHPLKHAVMREKDKPEKNSGGSSLVCSSSININGTKGTQAVEPTSSYDSAQNSADVLPATVDRATTSSGFTVEIPMVTNPQTSCTGASTLRLLQEHQTLQVSVFMLHQLVTQQQSELMKLQSTLRQVQESHASLAAQVNRMQAPSADPQPEGKLNTAFPQGSLPDHWCGYRTNMEASPSGISEREFQQGMMTLTAALANMGAKLSSTASATFGEAPVAGTSRCQLGARALSSSTQSRSFSQDREGLRSMETESTRAKNNDIEDEVPQCSRNMAEKPRSSDIPVNNLNLDMNLPSTSKSARIALQLRSRMPLTRTRYQTHPVLQNRSDESENIEISEDEAEWYDLVTPTISLNSYELQRPYSKTYRQRAKGTLFRNTRHRNDETKPVAAEVQHVSCLQTSPAKESDSKRAVPQHTRPQPASPPKPKIPSQKRALPPKRRLKPSVSAGPSTSWPQSSKNKVTNRNRTKQMSVKNTPRGHVAPKAPNAGKTMGGGKPQVQNAGWPGQQTTPQANNNVAKKKGRRIVKLKK